MVCKRVTKLFEGRPFMLALTLIGSRDGKTAQQRIESCADEFRQKGFDVQTDERSSGEGRLWVY